MRKAVLKAARFACLTVLLAFAACSGTTGPSPNMTLACKVDAAVQPLAAADVALLVGGSGAAAGVAVDDLLVHPAVVAICASVGGTPVAALASVASNPALVAALGKAAPAVAKAATVTTDVQSLIAAGSAAVVGSP